MSVLISIKWVDVDQDSLEATCVGQLFDVFACA